MSQSLLEGPVIEQCIKINDGIIILPKGTIKHLIGRELTYEDKPVCLQKNKVY